MRIIAGLGVFVLATFLGLGIARSMWADAVIPLIESVQDGRLDAVLIAARTFDSIVALFVGGIVIAIGNAIGTVIITSGDE